MKKMMTYSVLALLFVSVQNQNQKKEQLKK
jgi:hypothetical protein